MVNIFSQDLTCQQLSSQIGSLAQIGGIRQFSCTNGSEKGMPILQMYNASGLTIDILPGRCFDIGQIWCKGMPMAWLGFNGIPMNAATGAMETAIGGMMATCGFDHIRQPETVNNLHYPLHGSMALQPGKITHCSPVWQDDNCTLQVEGEVSQFALNKGGHHLLRCLEMPLDKNSLVIKDVVTIIGHAPLPIMALYHFNFGYPLICENTQLYIRHEGEQRELPLDNGININSLPPCEVTISLHCKINSQFFGVSLTFDGKALPYLQTYGRLEAGVNLFCLEPCTHNRKSRVDLTDEGDLVCLDSGYSEERTIFIEFHNYCLDGSYNK